MQLLVKTMGVGLSVLLLCTATLAYFGAGKQNDLHIKRSSTNSFRLKRGKLQFKTLMPRPLTLARTRTSVIPECEASGSPQPTIHWLKNGERIKQGFFTDMSDDGATNEKSIGRHSEKLLQMGGTKSKLFLDCVTERTQGNYTCVAETPYKRISRSTELRLDNVANMLRANVDDPQCLIKRSLKGEPARIYLWTNNRIEIEGADVQLFCRAEGLPVPVVSWIDRDGNLVQQSDHRFEVLSNGDLLIRDIRWKTHIGVYTCIATNPTGTDKVETFLYPTTR